MIIEVASRFQFEEVIATTQVVLVDFYADWCEPCKWLDSILIDVEENIPGEVAILKINSEQLFELTQNFQVMSVPVLLLFKNGLLIWRMNGFLTAAELTEKINSISRETS